MWKLKPGSLGSRKVGYINLPPLFGAGATQGECDLILGGWTCSSRVDSNLRDVETKKGEILSGTIRSVGSSYASTSETWFE